MKRIYRLTALILVLMMLVNLSALATTTTGGIPLDELDAESYAAMLADATENEQTLSDPCSETNVYCANVAELVALPTAQARYDYMQAMYSTDADNVELEGTMLHYHYYKAEHSADGLICECDFPSLAPEYEPGALDVHEEDCPWTFANLSVAEQYAVVCLMTAEEQAPYIATLSVEQAAALETYTTEQEEDTLSYPCEEKPEYCLFSEYSHMNATELYDYFNKMYAEDGDGEMSVRYTAVMIHYAEYHLGSHLICTCGQHPLPLPEYQVGDVNIHVATCPWHFNNLTTGEQYTLLNSATSTDEQKAAFQAALAQNPAAQEKLGRVNATDYTASGEGTSVQISAPTGTFAADYILSAVSAALNEAQQAAMDALEELHLITSFDISFANLMKESEKLQPTTPVELTFTIDTAELLGSSLLVHHLKDNGDGTYTAELLTEVTIDKTQTTQTVVVKCGSFSAVTVSEGCDGKSCGYNDFAALSGFEREAQLVAWANVTVNETSSSLSQYDNFMAHLYESHKSADEVCFCMPRDFTMQTYGSINHQTDAWNFYDEKVVCPWHFSQIPTADQYTVLESVAEEDKSAYLATLDDAAKEKLAGVNATEYTATGDSTSVQINVPTGAFATDYILNAGSTVLADKQLTAAEALAGVKVVAAFDISFADLNNESTKLTPSAAIELSFAIDTSALEGTSLQVYHLLGDETSGYTVEAVGSASMVDRTLTTQTISVSATAFSAYFVGETCDGSACDVNEGQTYSYNEFMKLTTAEARHTYLNDLYSEGDTDTDLEAFLLHLAVYHLDAVELICTCNIYPIPAVGSADHDEDCPWREATTITTLPTENGSISGVIPAGAVAVMKPTDVNQAVVDALIPSSAYVEGTMTVNAYDITVNVADTEWMPTEPVTVQVNGIVNANLEDPLVAVIHLLDSAEAIAKEQAKGNVYIIEDAEIVAAFPTELAAAQAAGLGDVVAFTGMTSENGVTINADGGVTFQTNSFSDYYLVSGSQSDDGGNDTFHILRGTNVQLENVTNNNYTVTYPDDVTAANSGVVITRNNNILTFTATENAVYGTYVIQISSNRTATIYIHDPQELFKLEEDSENAWWGGIEGFSDDVYFTVITDSSTIPSEPVAGGTASWNYIKKNNNGNYTFSLNATGQNGRYQTSPVDFLKLDEIAASDKLTQNMTGQNTIGVIDSGLGEDTLPCVELTSDEWHNILVQFVSGNRTVYISNGSGGRTPLTSNMVNERLDDGKTYRYQMYPYVVKLIINGGSGQDGWHVDCCVVDTKTYYVSYEYNLPDSAILDEGGRELIKPDTKLYSPGTTGVSVGAMKLDNTTLGDSNSITIYDSVSMSTSEYTFKGWNTEPDGTGTPYNPNNTLPAINSNVTLYAIWEVRQTSAAVKISKNEVFQDPDDARKGNTGPYVFTVTMTGASTDNTYPYESYNADGTKKGNGSIATGGELRLLNGEYAIINNVPAGTVTVSETASADYATSWVAGENTSTTNSVSAQLVAASQLEFKCTNTYAPLNGTLTINKNLVDASNQSGTFTFTFTVTPKDGKALPELSGVTGATVTVTNNVATVVMTVDAGSNASVTLPDLPMGEYTVQEQSATNYDTTVQVGTAAATTATSATVEVPAGDEAELTFTNTRKLGNLKISKTVQGEYAPDSTFTFETTLTGAGNSTYSYKVYNTADGTEVASSAGSIGGTLKTIELKDGQYALITGIPQGAQYSVQEISIPDGFEVTPATASGNISADAVEEAAFTNEHQVGSLTINKTATPDTDGYFVFQIEQGDTEVMKVYIQGSGSTTISNLPAGSYTVTELDSAWRYKLAENETAVRSVTVETGKTATVTYKNVHETDKWLDDETLVDNKFN